MKKWLYWVFGGLALVVILSFLVVVFEGGNLGITSNVVNGQIEQEPTTLKCQDYELSEKIIEQKGVTKRVGIDSKSLCPNLESPPDVFHKSIILGYIIKNPNDFKLNIPCSLVVKKVDWKTGEVLEEKIIESLNINVPANWEVVGEEGIEFPDECWTGYGLECQELELLPECQ